jgi:hypothetical protein
MSKPKPAPASKRVRNPKKAARAQRNKQAIVRSPKEEFLRSVAAVSIEPPLELHDDPKHDAPPIETRVDALPGDLSQRMSDSDPAKGVPLATANMQAYQTKLLQIAQANGQFAFEFYLRLTAIRSPTDFFAVIMEFTSKRIEMFGQHARKWQHIRSGASMRLGSSRFRLEDDAMPLAAQRDERNADYGLLASAGRVRLTRRGGSMCHSPQADQRVGRYGVGFLG